MCSLYFFRQVFDRFTNDFKVAYYRILSLRICVE
jgi:hypothetical protein